MIVIHNDMRVLGYCNSGARQFFAQHNLNWADFLQNGIDDAILVQLNDAMADAAIAQAKRRLGIPDGQ